MGEIADKLAKMKYCKRIAYLGNLRSLINANNIEQSSQYFKLLTDYEFIEAKVNHPKYGIELLIQDYDLINNDSLTNYQDNYQNITAEIFNDLKLIKEAMQLSAHVLKQDAKQLAGQLTGRLLPID